MNAPGKGLLKTTGILLIVYGSLSFIIALLVTAGSLLLATIFGAIFKGLAKPLSGAFLPFLLAGAGLGIVDLVLGIVGLVRSGKPTAAFFFVSSAALALLHAGYAVYISVYSSFFLYYGLVGIIFAALYMAGGIVKRRGAAAAPEAGA